RTVWGVVWSCLSTIFLCTWVAVHPNVAFRPEKRDAGWFETWIRDRLHDFFTYKLLLFSWPLLVPEYILSWAVRQYVRADQIQKQGNFSSRNISRIPTKSLVPGWTKSHGFFVLMGGFHLFRLPPDAPSIPLPLKGTSSIYLSTCLEIITPTKAKLKDEGKIDSLTNLIVLVQTSWFFIQCIARGIQSLPLTELEVVTLAYAMLNLFIYTFWWDKPRNLECPIRVYKAST
ncbi:hypothetical protein M408DRAFT_31933, partial [Serendipita vermifera MAFF 305830]